ncbi:MAG: non-canonical purine NTP pyrophosphatase [Acidobacteriia bacterium]|nr:non-canonical purine NTP pyrophosphatase [Terriglobia bacterium]MYG03838.1 non-canonical purine NTP pyrophosphatase [Terriglobia bacterium]MYK08601.1 non-canonical purine NTP pyrophosphatase [Terriglobia bacterium]
MLELVCATSNRGKLREFRLASGTDISIAGCPTADCPETGATFEANAIQKALCYHRLNPAAWLFADDSGLEVDVLEGAPGIHSARFAGPAATDRENNLLLLRSLAGVPPESRTARFVCTIALLHDGRLARTFRGTVRGRVLRRHSGRQGFGYDPLFYYPPLRVSFGHIPADMKWQHSHRGRAFRAMLAWLRDNQ